VTPHAAAAEFACTAFIEFAVALLATLRPALRAASVDTARPLWKAVPDMYPEARVRYGYRRTWALTGFQLRLGKELRTIATPCALRRQVDSVARQLPVQPRGVTRVREA
jgi:hypothetical protein